MKEKEKIEVRIAGNHDSNIDSEEEEKEKMKAGKLHGNLLDCSTILQSSQVKSLSEKYPVWEQWGFLCVFVLGHSL